MRHHALAVALGVAAALGACGEGAKQDAAPPPLTPALATVDVYVMSKCPHAAGALTELTPVIEQFKGKVALNIDYMGVALEKSDVLFKSLRGPEEVEGDTIAVCVRAQAPDKLLAFLGCMNEKVDEIPRHYLACASKVGLDADQLTECESGDQGVRLLRESCARTAKIGPVASPWILISGEIYQGPRVGRAFTRAICAKIPADARPATCNDMPAPDKVNALIISDKRCADCGADVLQQSLTRSVPGITARILDWSDPEAQRLASEAGITRLPAVVFDQSIASASEAKALFGPRLKAAGNHWILATPAAFDPLHPDAGVPDHDPHGH